MGTAAKVTPLNARFGWKDRPEFVAEAIEGMPRPIFATAASRELLATEHRDIFFWEQGEIPLFGDTLPAHRQTVGDCYAGDAQILGRRTKAIRDVELCDEIFDGTGAMTRVISKVKKLVNRPLLRIKCLGALPTRVTADHQLLVIRPAVRGGRRAIPSRLESEAKQFGEAPAVKQLRKLVSETVPTWIRAGELESGDYLLHPKIEPDAEELNAQERFWLGLFLANGHASGGSVEWTLPQESPHLERLVNGLRACGWSPRTGQYKTRKAVRVRVHSRTLVAWLRETFYDDDGVKQFPTWAIGKREFLDGLMAGDGHRAGKSRCLTSTSMSVIHGAEASLIAMGYSPSVGKHPRGVGTYDNAKPLFRCQFVESPEKRYGQWWHGYYARRIDSITAEEGPHEVYDIGVASPYHSFIANGTVGHNCVSQAWARGVQDLVFMAAARAGYDTPDLREQVATEPLYGFSRVEVGKGRIGGDGSTGAWAARAVTDWGVLKRRVYGEYDFRKYSGQLARTYGRSGVPNDLEPIARERIVDTTSLVVTDDEAKAALYNGYPLPVCSNQGFKQTRDKYGFCDPSGNWAHCMLARGICMAKRGGSFELAIPIQQSWGESPTGSHEVELQSGRTLKLPQGVFLIEFEVLLRMLKGWRDSFAMTGGKTFLPQKPIFVV